MCYARPVVCAKQRVVSDKQGEISHSTGRHQSPCAFKQARGALNLGTEPSLSSMPRCFCGPRPRAAPLLLIISCLVPLPANGSRAAPASMPLTLSPCATGFANQTFSMTTVPPYVEKAAVSVLSGGFCLELAAKDAPKGSPVTASGCSRTAMNLRATQYWSITPAGTIKSLQLVAASCFGLVNAAAAAAAAAAATAARLMDCTSADAHFSFVDGFPGGSSSSTLVHTRSGLCVTAAGPPPALPPIPPNPPVPRPSPFPFPSPPPPLPVDPRPCDIYASGGTPCVAAHSMVRALFAGFAGKLYAVKRRSDGASLDVGVAVGGGSRGGFADAAAQDAFCRGTDCVVQTIYDQSPYGNHLRADHPGRHYPVDRGLNASAHPITVGGGRFRAYGGWFDPGMGYRNDNTTAIALGNQSESMYAVMGGDHWNDVCCFDVSPAGSCGVAWRCSELLVAVSKYGFQKRCCPPAY